MYHIYVRTMTNAIKRENPYRRAPRPNFSSSAAHGLGYFQVRSCLVVVPHRKVAVALIRNEADRGGIGLISEPGPD
jgi:hypothetical protein